MRVSVVVFSVSNKLLNVLHGPSGALTDQRVIGVAVAFDLIL
jgi:hypothetical protein